MTTPTPDRAPRGGRPACWLCGGLGGIAIHQEWTARRGQPLWTAHTPASDSHPVNPCPACPPPSRRRQPPMPEPMKPEDVPMPLVDAAWPVCEREGIPWHDDAVRMILAAALPAARKAWFAELFGTPEESAGPPPCPRPLDQCEHVFHCGQCGAGSCHPGDADNKYCGACGFVDADRFAPAQLRAQLARRTREWRDEQQSRIRAEEARIAADKASVLTRDALRRFADRLIQPHASDPANLIDIAQEMRTAADLFAVGAGKAVDGAIVCGRGEPAPEADAVGALTPPDSGFWDDLRHAFTDPAFRQAFIDFSAVVRAAREEAQEDDVVRCRVCGCTDEAACPGGCHWIPDPTGDLCSRCEGAIVRVTVEDLDNGDREVRGVPAGNYFIGATDPCTYDLTPFPGGFHRITVKGIQDGTP